MNKVFVILAVQEYSNSEAEVIAIYANRQRAITQMIESAKVLDAYSHLQVVEVELEKLHYEIGIESGLVHATAICGGEK